MRRLDWDTCWLTIAYVIARRTRCVRSGAPGAVIVSKNNRIVATGYVGPPASHRSVHDPLQSTCDKFCTRGRLGPTDETRLSYADCLSTHAELNSLLVCDRSDREDGTIYVTSGPCWTCAKAIANSGLSRAVIVDTRDEHEYRDLDASYDVIRDSGLVLDLIDPTTIEEVRRVG